MADNFNQCDGSEEDIVARADATQALADAGASQAAANNALAGSFYAAVVRNVLALRGVGVTYTNTSGGAMQVHVGYSTQAAAAASALVIISGGVSMAGSCEAAVGGQGFVSAVIPSGASYQVVQNSGVCTPIRWVETSV